MRAFGILKWKVHLISSLVTDYFRAGRKTVYRSSKPSRLQLRNLKYKEILDYNQEWAQYVVGLGHQFLKTAILLIYICVVGKKKAGEQII